MRIRLTGETRVGCSSTRSTNRPKPVPLHLPEVFEIDFRSSLDDSSVRSIDDISPDVIRLTVCCVPLEMPEERGEMSNERMTILLQNVRVRDVFLR